MSDYLARVAARALGQADVALPRLPSLFEPLAADVALPDGAARQSASPSSVASPAPQREDRADAVPIHEPPVLEPAAERSRMPAAGDLDAPNRPTQRPRESSQPAAMPARPSAAPPRGTPIVTMAAGHGNQPQAAVARTMARPAGALSLAPAATGAAPAPIVVTPQVAAVPEITRPEVAREPIAPSPPIVRVTIGRVEVRARMPAAPPAPAPAPRRREPTLSLTDYLKQRDEGRR